MRYKIFILIDKVLIFSIQKINKLHLSILEKFTLKETSYQFLTANDSAENIEEYSKALTDALENSKVKNIAISGSYGSGKSSFIKTFEKQNSQYNFLDISLATFKPKENLEKENKTDLSLIEKSILEQIFYKVKNKKIPQSRLKKINRLKMIPIKIVSILTLVLAYFITFHPEKIEKILVLKEVLVVNNIDYLKYIPILLLIVGSYFIVQKILILISNTNIEKLNLQNVELGSNLKSASLLNMHLDEILYFFEKTNFDVVVFQDLDRFENLEIFTKLRELNNFINNSEQVAKKIVFIYAVKDEMFKSANERTKFFDFLIPIIPYINATNSKDVLLRYFKDVEKNFIYDISLFISDMRLVNNVFNEYLTYKNTFKNDKLDKTKLLAMIIYKNFEPQDFEALHESKGLVYKLFHSEIKEYLKSHIEKIDNEIHSIKNRIKEIQEEPREAIKELRELYILKIIEKSNQRFSNTIFTDSNSFNIQEAIKDNNFQLIIESNGLGTYNNQSYLNVKFDVLEKELGKYKDREQLIIYKMNNNKNSLIKQIEDLKKEEERLKYISIRELFEEFTDVTIIEELKEVYTLEDKEISITFGNKELMQYLLLYGHIDENYEEYISNFFGVSITKDEQDFLRNVKNNGSALKFDYPLNNIEEIIEHRLTVNEFLKESLFNLQLLDFLLENTPKYNKQLIKIFQKLSDESEKSKGFILYSLENSKQQIKFIKTLVQYWKNYWLYISKESQLELEKQKEYFELLVKNIDLEILLKLDANDYIKEFIKINSFLPSYDRTNDKFESLISKLQIKYSFLNEEEMKKVPLTIDFIYKNELYEINEKMIEIFIKRCDIDTSQLQISNYTSIKQMSGKMNELIVYINDEINTYVENVLLKIDTNTKESEEVIIELLENDKLDKKLKIKLIEKEENKISDIESINSSLWEELLKNNKLVANWDNAFKCYNDKNTSNDLLLQYLNIEENAKEITKVKCGDEYSKANEFFTQSLLKLIIKTNTFNIISYEYLIKNTGWCYTDIDISTLDVEKISLLIKYNRFTFEKESFDLLKEYTDELHIALIEKNKTKLLDEFEKFGFDTNDLVKILEIDKSVLSDKTKEDLIEKIDYDLILDKTIAKLIYQYVDKSIIKSINYTKKMLETLESLESKINLIIEQNSEFNDEEFIEILELLPDEYSKIKNLDGKQTVVEDNYYNKKLIKILKDREFITSATDDKRNKNKIRLYIKDGKI